MCMKINKVSSNPKSNIGVEAGGRDRPGFVPSAAPTIQSRARHAQPGLVMPRVEDSQQPKCRGRGRKVARGESSTLKDVKNEGRSGNVYENKGSYDNLSDTKVGHLCPVAPRFTQMHTYFAETVGSLVAIRVLETEPDGSKSRNSRGRVLPPHGGVKSLPHNSQIVLFSTVNVVVYSYRDKFRDGANCQMSATVIGRDEWRTLRRQMGFRGWNLAG